MLPVHDNKIKLVSGYISHNYITADCFCLLCMCTREVYQMNHLVNCVFSIIENKSMDKHFFSDSSQVLERLN